MFKDKPSWRTLPTNKWASLKFCRQRSVETLRESLSRTKQSHFLKAIWNQQGFSKQNKNLIWRFCFDFFSSGTKLFCFLSLGDQIRPFAQNIVQQVEGMKIRTWTLTRDFVQKMLRSCYIKLLKRLSWVMSDGIEWTKHFITRYSSHNA